MTPKDHDWAQWARQLLLPLSLEVAAHYLRLPLHPGFAPFLLRDRPPRSVLVVLAVAVAGVELSSLGLGAWEFVAAMLFGAQVTSRLSRHRGLAFSFVSGASWALIGWALNRFPTGAPGIEPLLTAVLVRLTGDEVVAALAARFALSALVYGTAVLVPPIQRGLRRVPLALAMLVMLGGCGQPVPREFFHREPEAATDMMFAVEFPDAGNPFEHPVPKTLTGKNDACLGCHAQRIAPTNRPLAQKDVHEIHYNHVKLTLPCVLCHEGADRPGFLGEFPNQRRRREFNQKCVSCHTDGRGPHWPRRMR